MTSPGLLGYSLRMPLSASRAKAVACSGVIFNASFGAAGPLAGGSATATTDVNERTMVDAKTPPPARFTAIGWRSNPGGIPGGRQKPTTAFGRGSEGEK